MKKTLALILAIVMMAAMAVPAFAETPAEAGVTTELVSNGNGNSCKVTYGVGQTYTVSLPTAINFAMDNDLEAANEQFCEVIVKNLVINGSKSLVVTMDSTNEGREADENLNGWNMLAANCDPVVYTVTKSAPTVANGAHVTLDLVNNKVANAVSPAPATTILTVASNAAGVGGGVKLTFTTAGTSQAGDYVDTITFGVAIVG